MFINIGWNFLYKRFFYADNKKLINYVAYVSSVVLLTFAESLSIYLESVSTIKQRQ
ncbi:hypothetical protein HORM4_240093 [Vibrio harveyi]|nr:hypothetical protein HORM4_240093 [Vibrio harveyi]